MPYADEAQSRACAKKHYDAKAGQIQRQRQFKRLTAHFQQNQEERERGVVPTSLYPCPKASTLEKQGIRVFLAEEGGTEGTKGFVQTRAPLLLENWEQRPTLPVSTPQSVEGTLSVMEHKINQLEATLTTKTLHTIWRRFELNVNRSGCDNVLAWVNNGKLLDFIKRQYPNRNTLKAHLYSYWWLIVEADSLPQVLPRAKQAITRAFKGSSEHVRVEQVLKALDGNEQVKPFNVILEEARAKFDALSDEIVCLTVYEELTLRDDFPDVYVYKTDPGRITNKNYYVCVTGTIHFNYRNKNKRMERFSYKFSEETKELLNRYVEKHDQEKLFPKKPRDILKNVGVSVNVLRHAKVTELYDDPDLTDEQKEDLAEKMGHSVFMQLTYRRGRQGKFVIASA